MATTQTSCEATEQIVREWLRREMSMDMESIDYDAPFFDLGIDSMGAMSIAAELEDAFGKKINPELIYELESIRELAAHLDSLPKVSLSAEDANDHDDAATAAEPPSESGLSSQQNVEDPIRYFTRLNRKVNTAKEQGVYPFEPEISSHEGVWVQCEGKRMLMLASYEYLGLLGHPELNCAAETAIGDYGTGHHGSRLLTGTTSSTLR